MKNKISLWKIDEQYSIQDLLDHLETNSYHRHKSSDDWAMLIKTKEPKPVSWEEFVSPLLEDNQDAPTSSNSSFVYLITVDAKLYALTGGYGHTAISNHVNQEFGLDVATRLITDANQINALNQSAFKGPIRQQFRTVENYNILSDRENFDKLLKHLQAKTEFMGQSITISARSNLGFRVDEPISRVPDIIREVNTILGRPINIDIPKSYEVIKDAKLCSTLDNRLTEDFSAFWNENGTRERLYIEFDDPLIQFSSEKFILKIGNGRRERRVELADLDLEAITPTMKSVLELDGTEITKTILEKLYVFGVTVDGIQQGGGTLYNLLTYDVQSNNTDYVKMGKRWYRIDQRFVDNLDEILSRVELFADIPEWNTAIHPTENSFNRWFAAKISGNCLDADCVQFGQQKIELCDVLDLRNSTMYHIKKTWGAKSSYLFLQGATAIDYYENNEEFRLACATKWPDIFANRMNQGTLIFGIGVNENKIARFPQNLTFFAKVNLVDAYKKIKDLEWKVKLAPFLVH